MAIEKNIENRIKRYFEQNNAIVFKHFGGALGTPDGWPDLLIIYNNVPAYIEVKEPRGVLSNIQKAQIRRIRNKGVIAIATDDFNDAKRLKEAISNNDLTNCNKLGWSI